MTIDSMAEDLTEARELVQELKAEMARLKADYEPSSPSHAARTVSRGDIASVRDEHMARARQSSRTGAEPEEP